MHIRFFVGHKKDGAKGAKNVFSQFLFRHYAFSLNFSIFIG